MDRLRLLLSLVLAGVISSSLSAQLIPGSGLAPQSTSASGPRSFVVIGDVVNCNQFAIQAGQTATIRGAVEAAQPLSESVSVSVLRQGQSRVFFTQMLNAGSTGGQEPVCDGDILIVQAIGRTESTASRNAALRTPSGTIVVALADESVAVGDVLLQTGSMPAKGVPLQIVCRLGGKPGIAEVTLSELVAHGDVIAIGTAPVMTPAGGSRVLLPAVSEWISAPNEVISAASQQPSTSPDFAAQSPAMEFLVPSPADETTADTLPDPAEPVGAPAEFPDSSSSSDPFLEVPDESPAPYAATFPIAQSQVLDAPESTGTIGVVEGAATAPVPPVEQGISAPSGGTEISAWNILFISGLLIAGSLILAGSLRVDDDVPESTATVEREFTSVTEAPAPTALVERGGYTSSMEPFVQIADDPLPAPVAARRPGTAAPIGNLVVATEWFSGDWMQSGAVSGPPAAVSVSASTPVPRVKVAEELDQTLIETSKPPMSAPASQLESLAQAAAVAESQESGEMDPELEDLLQNRLPVDLQQAKLPLRVALFGRPAGPRYLRIDTAHSQLAGPHIAKSAERRREAAGAAMASVPERQSLESDRFSDSSTSLHDRKR